MHQFKFLVLLTTAFISYIASAGELIFRGDYLNPKCSRTNISMIVENAVAVLPVISCNGIQVSVGRTLVDKANYDLTFDPSDVPTFSIHTANNVFAPTSSSTSYKAFSAYNDGILDKPVILVEGYDPDNSYWPDDYYNKGFYRFVSGGRDLLIVNLDSTKSMDYNADVLQNIIRDINGLKRGNVSNVVIGFSMGGIVARRALKNMEARGEDHQTSLYISYDSPHLGANIPYDLQDTINIMISTLDKDLFGFTPSNLSATRFKFNSPAARELLIAGPDHTDPSEPDFPQHLVRVAVTSGSLLGANGGGTQNNPVHEGDYVAGFRYYYSKGLFKESDSFMWYSKKRGDAYYDNVPGSYFLQFSDAYQELLDSGHTVQRWQAPAVQSITFIPTTSALAMRVDANLPLKDLFASKSPFDKFIAIDESGKNACDVFNNQSASGKNIFHSPQGTNSFNENQLQQVICAINQYQVPATQLIVPDRRIKQETKDPLSFLYTLIATSILLQ